jgi:3-hydroxymyristoyl/3-hydroxydecanoyl-(acyl carrier protein) dehydratase
LVSHGLVHSLDFPELVHRAYDAGARIFIEIGPRNTCSRRIGAILGAAPHETLAFDQQRGASARDSLARLLAALISQRVPVDLTAWLAMLPQTPANDARKRRVSLCGPSISEMVATKLRALPSLSSDEDFGHEPPVETRSPTVVLPIASSSRIGRGSAVGGALALWQHASRNRLHAHRSVLDQHLVRLRQRASPALQTREQKSVAPGVALYDEAAVMEFAEGRAARVFGKEYAAIDALPRRVRLPSPPFLAMSRVTALHAIPFRLEPCWIETEYDVPDPAWHGVDGYVPYMAADAQGVLFLLGYIGIDRHNQGQRMYRWLDAEMRFSGLALRAGQTVRYRIDIRSFVQHQETLLFFTDFSCRVDGDPFLEIRNCCAGFFSDEELSRGQGIRSGEMRRTASTAAGFQPLLRSEKESFSEEDLGRLQAGNAAACFGPNYGEMATGNPSLRLPPGPMRMIDRIRHAALPGLGGTRGEIVAEKDLDPGDWYLRTHFKDSPVFAGPCMMEGCFQLLQFYALYLGLAQRRAGLHFAPHGGIETKVRFRSQVPAEQSVFTIQMHVTTVSCEPCPAIVANFDLVHHGVTIGCIENLGIRLV